MFRGEPIARASLDDLREALNEGMVFGEAASFAGLNGSSPSGWDCPACDTVSALKEAHAHKGARCEMCGTGFDMIGVVMTSRSLSARATAIALVDHMQARDARCIETADLFGDIQERNTAHGG